jgi:hypothetical protein
MRRALVSLGFLALSVPALGQVTSIPPFVGTHSEGFDNVPYSTSACWPPRVFSDSADLCSFSTLSMYNGLWAHIVSGPYSCDLYPQQGARFLMNHFTQFEIVFDAPVSRFGGWFSHGPDSVAPPDTFEFYGSDGALIDTKVVSPAFGCVWTWFGWSSGAPIERVRVNIAAQGSFVGAIDSLEVDFAPPGPIVYCTAGTSSSGCVASISATGMPNLAHTAPCQIDVANVEGQKSGMVFYGLASQAQPWCTFGGSSILCVKAPIGRTFAQTTAGTLNACDGALTLDWNAFQTGHAGALGQPWTAGEKAFVQGWFRDPPACRLTSLSDAVELTYQP